MAALAESLRPTTRLATAMRTVTVALLLSVWCGTPPLFAAGLAGGTLLAAALAETTRLAAAPATAAQPSAPQARVRHPVLAGAAIGAVTGGLWGYFGTSCSVPPPDDRAACGTHYKVGAAVLGGGVGAGVGALVGLAFRH